MKTFFVEAMAILIAGLIVIGAATVLMYVAGK